MKILVTGGAGFIGSAVCHHLVGDLGWSVVNVDSLTYAANPASLASLDGNPRYAFARADIRDRAALDAILARHQPDAILHLAAESHVDRSIAGPQVFLETNVMGTATLLEATRSYRDRLPSSRRDALRLVHISTDEVFGSLGPDGHFREATAYDPSSPYSASKAASDHLVMAWGRTYGLPVLVTNCSNNYGPRQFPEKLIPLMILNALHGRPLPVYGTGLNVRDWLHVEDHARALVAVLERGRVGARYAIGGRAERSNVAVVAAICTLMDRHVPAGASHARHISHVADRPGHDLRYAIDPALIESELGWRSTIAFEDGLERTVRWYLDNPGWWSAIYPGQTSAAAGAP